MKAVFEQIEGEWLGEYKNGWIPINSELRKEALTILFERCKAAGITKDFFTNTIKGFITNDCINPNKREKSGKRHWIECVQKDMRAVLHTVYKEPVAQEENPLEAANVITEDFSDIPEEIEEIEKKPKESKPKKEKVEYFAENAPKGSPTNMKIDPEMAKLLGIDIDE